MAIILSAKSQTQFDIFVLNDLVPFESCDIAMNSRSVETLKSVSTDLEVGEGLVGCPFRAVRNKQGNSAPNDPFYYCYSFFNFVIESSILVVLS